VTLALLPVPRSVEAVGAGLRVEPGAPLDPRVEIDASLPAEGYALEIGPGGVQIRAADSNAERYARATLEQVRRQAGSALPGLVVRDWPDFAVRGFMLDVSRDRVPTPATLERLVEILDLLRVNQLQLYTEHTFKYRDHERVWRDASPLSPDDVQWLDALCRARGIELVANQNCFGHMGRWLKHDAYRPLAETPDGWHTPDGARREPSVLAPTGESLDFVLGLVRELIPNFRSRRINIGCDETWELGRGRSEAECEARGRGRVYLDFVLRILEALHRDGCEVQLWGDVLGQHPELIGSLPRERTVALVWGYEAPTDPASVPPDVLAAMEQLGWPREAWAGFSGRLGPFGESGIPFWVCPGTSSWNSLVGRLPNARANLLDAAESGLSRGASGVLITDWGDNGHLQPPSVSLPPLVYGAAVSWCLESNRDLDVAARLDQHVFDDAAGELGAALEKLGSVYRETGRVTPNASPLHLALVRSAASPLPGWGEVQRSGIERALEALEAASDAVARARPGCSDGEVVKRELVQAARLARHGAWRLARSQELPCPSTRDLRDDLSEAIDEQFGCWLERSRPGGLQDSLGRLHRALAEYGT
jgi:hypothetical protein